MKLTRFTSYKKAFANHSDAFINLSANMNFGQKLIVANLSQGNLSVAENILQLLELKCFSIYKLHENFNSWNLCKNQVASSESEINQNINKFIDSCILKNIYIIFGVQKSMYKYEITYRNNVIYEIDFYSKDPVALDKEGQRFKFKDWEKFNESLGSLFNDLIT